MLGQKNCFNPRIYSSIVVFFTQTQGQLLLFLCYLVIWPYGFANTELILFLTIAIYFQSTGYPIALLFSILTFGAVYDLLHNSYCGLILLLLYVTLIMGISLYSYLFSSYLRVNSNHWRTHFNYFYKFQSVMFLVIVLMKFCGFDVNSLLLTSCCTTIAINVTIFFFCNDRVSVSGLMFSMAIPVFILLNCEPLHCMEFAENAIKNLGKKPKIKVDPKGVVVGGLGGMALEKLRQLGMDEFGNTVHNYYSKLEFLGVDKEDPLIQKLVGMKNSFRPEEIIEGFNHQYALDKKSVEVFLSLHHSEHVSNLASVKKMTNIEKYHYLQEKLGKDYNVGCFQRGIGEIPEFSKNVLRFPLPDDVIALNSAPASKNLSYGKGFSTQEKPSIQEKVPSTTLKSNETSDSKPKKKSTLQMWQILNHSHKGNPYFDEVYNPNKGKRCSYNGNSSPRMGSLLQNKF